MKLSFKRFLIKEGGKATAEWNTKRAFPEDVKTAVAKVAKALDRHLWTHPPTGFVPHVEVNSPLVDETPVVIAGKLDSVTQDERLINLSPEVPPGFSRFASLIEIVGVGDEERLAGRKRARFYKDRGYDVKYLDLSGKG